MLLSWRHHVISLILGLLGLVACTSDTQQPSNHYSFPISITNNISAATATIAYDADALIFQKAKAVNPDVVFQVMPQDKQVVIALIAKSGSASSELVSLEFKKNQKAGAARVVSLETVPAANISAGAVQVRAVTLGYGTNDISVELANYELGDVNQDGAYNIVDLAQLNDATIQGVANAGQVLADFNGDGVFNTADQLTALSKFVARLGGVASDAGIIVHPRGIQHGDLGESFVVVAYNNGQTPLDLICAQRDISPSNGSGHQLGPQARIPSTTGCRIDDDIDISNEVLGYSAALHITPQSEGLHKYTIYSNQAGVNSTEVLINIAGSGSTTGDTTSSTTGSSTSGDSGSSTTGGTGSSTTSGTGSGTTGSTTSSSSTSGSTSGSSGGSTTGGATGGGSNDLDKLVISEISTSPFSNSPNWVELFNGSDSAMSLSNMQIRTRVWLNGQYTTQAFNIPSYTLVAGDYVLLQADVHEDARAMPGRILLGDGDTWPYWWRDGFVELIQNGETLDFVRFGSDTTSPTSSEAWSGSNAPEIPGDSNARRQSLARDLSTSDSDTAQEWTIHLFSTPVGPNDVPADAVDNDQDGLPDSAEVPGGTFAGLDLYAMGARTGQPDIFIEVDWMDPSGYTHDGLGGIPQTESLTKIVTAFANQGIAVHFDTGSAISQFDLGNETAIVPFKTGIHFNTASSSSVANFYDYKAAYMPLARHAVFHYMLLGNAYEGRGIGGTAELNGNDIIITMGNLDWLTRDTTENSHNLINQQASTIMHELGHNLDLQHGGFEDLNYKPNYRSIMNYLYDGLGPTSGNHVGDWYYKEYGMKDINGFTVANSHYTDDFILDFSHGVGHDLNENAVDESEGIGYGPGWVDYNDNDIQDASTYSQDLTASNRDNELSILEDSDDWDNLQLPFRQSPSGQLSTVNGQPPATIDPLLDDFQTWVIEEPRHRQHH